MSEAMAAGEFFSRPSALTRAYLPHSSESDIRVKSDEPGAPDRLVQGFVSPERYNHLL